jgi:HK97 family phage major capsid protein
MNAPVKISASEIDERRLLRYGRIHPALDEKTAAIGGAWFLGINGNEKAARFAEQHGAPIVKGAAESTNSGGGALVPDVLMASIISLRELRGSFRANARIVPMRSDSASTARRTGGLTTFFTAEAAAITESNATWDNVALTAKKLATLTRSSAELDEDAIIDWGNWFLSEISYSFASKEDDCGWNGDGTSAFGGIRGITKLLTDGNHNAGKVAAASTHNTFATVDATDLTNLIAACPAFAMPGAKWFISQFGYAATMIRLAATAGSIVQTANGPEFWGFPVQKVQVMPATSATQTGNVLIAFGDMSLSSILAERRGVTISRSEGRYFDQNQIGWLGRERIDIVNSDLGDNANSGPLVGLIGTA